MLWDNLMASQVSTQDFYVAINRHHAAAANHCSIYDIILGLGFEGLALGGATTVFKNAIDQGKVSQQMFAFKLGDNSDSDLTFGGYGKLISDYSVKLVYVKLVITSICNGVLLLSFTLQLTISPSDFFITDDADFTGEITWTALSEPKYWQIDLENINVGSYTSGPTNGIVDSGTSLITGPSAEIAKIATAAGKSALYCFVL